MKKITVFDFLEIVQYELHWCWETTKVCSTLYTLLQLQENFTKAFSVWVLNLNLSPTSNTLHRRDARHATILWAFYRRLTRLLSPKGIVDHTITQIRKGQPVLFFSMYNDILHVKVTLKVIFQSNSHVIHFQMLGFGMVVERSPHWFS